MTTPTTREHVELDVDLDAEVACEAVHRRNHACSGSAVWRRPTFPCGCDRTRLVCELHREAVVLEIGGLGLAKCARCGGALDVPVWLARWTRL